MNSRELYLHAVKENGIAQPDYEKLLPNEQALLKRNPDGKYWLSPSARSSFKVVLTGGVFDILHIGHVLTLQHARGLGDILVVVVATNERVEKIKGKKPIHDADYRCAMVASLKSVDLAIVGANEMMDTFARVSPDIVAFGYDQKPFTLPSPCKSVHLEDVVSNEQMAKTSKVIRELGL